MSGRVGRQVRAAERTVLRLGRERLVVRAGQVRLTTTSFTADGVVVHPVGPGLVAELLPCPDWDATTLARLSPAPARLRLDGTGVDDLHQLAAKVAGHHGSELLVVAGTGWLEAVTVVRRHRMQAVELVNQAAWVAATSAHRDGALTAALTRLTELRDLARAQQAQVGTHTGRTRRSS